MYNESATLETRTNESDAIGSRTNESDPLKTRINENDPLETCNQSQSTKHVTKLSEFLEVQSLPVSQGIVNQGSLFSHSRVHGRQCCLAAEYFAWILTMV